MSENAIDSEECPMGVKAGIGGRGLFFKGPTKSGAVGHELPEPKTGSCYLLRSNSQHAWTMFPNISNRRRDADPPNERHTTLNLPHGAGHDPSPRQKNDGLMLHSTASLMFTIPCCLDPALFASSVACVSGSTSARVG
jgi:hypothetical protein